MESSDGHDTMTAGGVKQHVACVGRAKPECTLVLGQFMQIHAFILCVFILEQPLTIQRLDWVGLDPSFLRKLREIFPRHSGGGGRECLI